MNIQNAAEELTVLAGSEDDLESPSEINSSPLEGGRRLSFELANPALQMEEAHDVYGRIVKWDRNVSYKMFRWYHEHMKSRLALMVLEISGHGVPWLLLPVLFFLFDSDLTEEHAWLLVNFYIGQLLDLVYVSAMKTTIKRPRPAYNTGDLHLTVQMVDQFSFPSGHATRVTLVSTFLYYTAFSLGVKGFLVSSRGLAIVTMWSVIVAYSRVALGRHHLLDIVGGVVVGLVNMATVLSCWISEKTVTYWRHVLLSQAHTISVRCIELLS